MKCLTAMLLAGLLVSFASPLSAATFVEVDRVELTDLDPLTDNGRLGRNMALTGNTLLVAAPEKDGTDGAVYSFTVRGNGTLQFEQEVLPDADTFRFGNTLAADGEWAAIGETSDKVRLYRRSGSGWVQTQMLRLSDVPATPGITLRSLRDHASLSGDLLAMGDTSANLVVAGEPVSNAGAVVLFRRGPDSVWRHEATLIAPIPNGTAKFGSVISASGNTLLIGAPNDKVNDINVGGAFVFQRSGSGWSHAATLRNPEAENEAFGWSVALDGDVAIVGCPTCNVTQGGPTNAGSFFAFERNLGGSGNWGLRGEFVSTQPAYIDEFSVSLRLRGDTLMVGASNVKRAHFFRRAANGDWAEAAILQSIDPNNTFFGTSVEFVGGRALIGAEIYPNTGTSERWGAVHAWFGATVEACRGSFEGIFCDGFESVD